MPQVQNDGKPADILVVGLQSERPWDEKVSHHPIPDECSQGSGERAV